MFYLKMASQTSDAVEIRVADISFIVSGNVDSDRIYRALLEVLDDDAIGGRVCIHERATDTIEVPRYLSYHPHSEEHITSRVGLKGACMTAFALSKSKFNVHVLVKGI